MFVETRVRQQMMLNPGQTARELSWAIFGSDAYQQRVNPTCLAMVEQGQAVRCGNGTRSSPYR